MLLKNGFILNFETGTFEQRDVLIKDGLIQEIKADLTYKESVIDCRHQYIIPGLIDMHVHIKKQFAAHFVAAGVTTVRNTAGSMIELQEFVDASRQAFTPEVITADRMIDGPPGLWGDESPYNVNIDNKEDAIAEVERQVQLQADFIKVYGWLSEEIMEVVVKEAKKYDKEVSADLIYATEVDALKASAIGVNWLEHASGILQAIYPHWHTRADEQTYATINWEEPDVRKIEQICKKLLASNSKLCPTITLYDQIRLGNNYWNPHHEVTEHAMHHTTLNKQWQPLMEMNSAQLTLGIQTKWIQAIAYQYAKMGGTVVCGTDTPAGIYTFPGMALHRELELFVEAGFTPLEAIKCATLNAAKALNRETIGDIQEGFEANLVILNDNPLESISYTKAIAAVIKGGHYAVPTTILDTTPSADEMNQYYEQLIETFKSEGLPISF